MIRCERTEQFEERQNTMASGKELIKSRWILEAAGAALLLVGPWFYPMLLPGNIALYHHHLDFRSMIGGILLILVSVFLLSLAALVLLSRLPDLFHSLAEAILAGLCIWIILQTLSSLYFEHLRSNLADLTHPLQMKLTVWNILPAVCIGESKSLVVTIPSCLVLLVFLKIKRGRGIARTIRTSAGSILFLWDMDSPATGLYSL